MSITAGEVLSILMSIFYFRKYQKYVERKSIKWDRAASEIEEAALAFLWYTDISLI